MKTNIFFIAGVLNVLAGGYASAQDVEQGLPHTLQAARDARAPQVFAETCVTPPATRELRLATDEEDPGPMEYSVSAIPGVISAGQNWELIWEGEGHNADGIVGVNDGILIAQNSKGIILKVGFDGSTSYPYPDTRTGGSLSMNVAGDVFVVERALYPAITQVSPVRRELANTYNGEPLHCLGGVLNDLAADRRGGVYFTHGGLFHAAPDGTITQYGEGLATNGIILSPDEQVLYVTNGNALMAFDVQSDGSLTEQRVHAELPMSSRGDGLAVDREGRVYVTAFDAGVHVIDAEGNILGTIPTPRRVISAAFGGPDKQTLFVVGSTRQNGYGVELLAIEMLAQGYLGRAK